MTDAQASTLTDHELGGEYVDGGVGKPRSLRADAWRSLRRNPLFWISAVGILFFVVMAIAPELFTNTDPRATGPVRERPNSDAWFGRDGQGYDIYARVVHGARASILVGIFATLATATIGVFIGTMAAYFGGWIDSVLSRVTDVFFAIPLLLGGILLMTSFPSGQDSSYLAVVGKVVLAITIFGWPSVARLMRGSVLQVKPNEYVQAAKALGASTPRIMLSHILPNALTPVIAFSTVALGVYIVAEATLSFLGIGLVPPAISWGLSINDALTFSRTYPHILLFPCLALSLCVLSFIMLGDAVRDAFDPKSH